MAKKTVLTGIKPTGIPHLGNLVGAIRPGLAMAESPEFRSFFFIAEYHALISLHDPKQMRELIYEIAAAWLAFGLDPERVVFYRQGDVPETFELSWILSCFTPKGLMNRAHAYKAAVDKNRESGNPDLDAGINMGLYSYPVLMSADILLFRSNLVPVGKDQLQHVEIARDVAGKFNQVYGDVFTLPEHMISERTAVLPGLDGRKMSKSYDNTIPLFVEPKRLQKLISSIKTDSTPPEAPKDAESSHVFQLYRAIGTPGQAAELERKYREGISWGAAKAQLFELVNSVVEKPRARYLELMADKGEIDRLLRKGAERARAEAAPLMDAVRKAVGFSA